MTDYEKMTAGELFNQTNISLLVRMARTYCLVRKLNRTSLLNQPKRNRLLKKIFGTIDGKKLYSQREMEVVKWKHGKRKWTKVVPERLNG